LITVSHNTKLKRDLRCLQENNILSVPVIDSTNQFIGFVDVLDIAGFILSTWRNISVNLDDTHFPIQELNNTPVINVLNFSNVNYPVIIPIDKNVGDLISIFKDPKTYYRLHRVGVVSKTGTLENVLSQTDIINFAADHINALPSDEVNMPVGKIKEFIRSPIMVRIDDSFADTLDKLFRNRISGLALVDHEFKLCGNLSASDLRGINPMAFDFFLGSTFQFLCKGTNRGPSITQSVGVGNTFGEVLQLLSKKKDS